MDNKHNNKKTESCAKCMEDPCVCSDKSATRKETKNPNNQPQKKPARISWI